MPISRAPITITNPHGCFVVQSDRKLGLWTVFQGGLIALKFQSEYFDSIPARLALIWRFVLSSLIGAPIHAATRAGLRDIIYHEDALFTPLALVRAKSLVRLRATCYRYRLQRPGSIMTLSRPEKHLSDMMLIAEALGVHAGLTAAGSAQQNALAREVGFALASALYYAVRIDGRDRRRVAPFERILAVGARWWRHFPLRVLVNYGRPHNYSIFTKNK